MFSTLNTLGYNHYEIHDSLPGGGCIALWLRWRSSEAATHMYRNGPDRRTGKHRPDLRRAQAK